MRQVMGPELPEYFIRRFDTGFELIQKLQKRGRIDHITLRLQMLYHPSNARYFALKMSSSVASKEALCLVFLTDFSAIKSGQRDDTVLTFVILRARFERELADQQQLNERKLRVFAVKTVEQLSGEERAR